MRKMRDHSEARLELHASPARGWRRYVGFAAAYGVFAVGIAWFSFAMVDPNYKWIFVDDNVMRVRNAALILLFVYWLLAVRRMQQLAFGRRPLAVLTRSAGQVVVTKESLAPFAHSRVDALTLPVEAQFQDHRDIRIFPGVRVSSVLLRGARSSSRVYSMWSWAESTDDALKEFLGGADC